MTTGAEKQPLTNEQLDTATAFLRKLVGLNIGAKLLRVEAGPVITGYFFHLDHDVPISKILKRSEDFALAAAAEKVTIQREGGEIVIFAANKERKLVEFKDYLYWFATDKTVREMKIPIPLGVDYLGNKQALDLTECPHLLLAGATGSGKSVFESAVLSSLSIVKTPAELLIYLVDTKQLDLPLFSGLPHVRQTVVTLSEYHRMMSNLLAEHELRKMKLANASVRNLREYHGMFGSDSLPYILILIDEFADLLEQDKADRRTKSKREQENPPADVWLKRLAQIARATGIHIICGTQRTSVEVIDGDIKVNFPARLSLRLPTEADSRTILGVGGAENLLGKGDFFLKTDKAETLKRYHGPLVNLHDIERIVVQNSELREQFAR